jgi:hypothetical protein
LLIHDINYLIKDYDNVNIVYSEKWRIFDWERVTYLYNKIKSEHPDDWWVIADVDEFQIYSKTIYEIVDECEENGWEFVTGGFLDRVGSNGTFPKIYENDSIWKQFPMVGFFRYPISNACPNKVTLCRGKIEICNGQHYAIIDGHTTWRWQGWNHPLRYPVDKNFTQVHHFKWDYSCKRRLKDVVNIKKDYAFSDEYKNMYDYLKNNNFKIDINNKNYYFENLPIFGYEYYRNWQQLTKKIISI